MIYVDTRAGSKELIRTDSTTGKTFLIGTQQPITPTTLRSGDVSFLGNGPDGGFITVGIEYKKLGDALKCMTDGRLSGHQLPLLHEDYQERWLLLEGVWRANPTTGLMEQQWFNPYSHKLQWIESKLGNRHFTILEFNSWLMTLGHPLLGGLRLWVTPDQTASAAFIFNLHSWWTNKEFEDNRSHLHPDNSDAPTHLFKKPKTQAERSQRLAERAAAQLDGIGWGKAAKVAAHFKTLINMVLAGPDEWRKVDGIGKVLSERVVCDITNTEAKKK